MLLPPPGLPVSQSSVKNPRVTVLKVAMSMKNFPPVGGIQHILEGGFEDAGHGRIAAAGLPRTVRDEDVVGSRFWMLSVPKGMVPRKLIRLSV